MAETNDEVLKIRASRFSAATHLLVCLETKQKMVVARLEEIEAEQKKLIEHIRALKEFQTTVAEALEASRQQFYQSIVDE